MAETGPSGRVIHLRSRLDELGRLHLFVAEFCRGGGLPAAEAFALSLALDELVTNVIMHGCSDSGEHEIQVALSTAGDRVVVEMEDDARPFDPTEANPTDLSADLHDRQIGGLGLRFVRGAMDEMSYQRVDGLNRLRMTKRIAPGPAERER